MTQKLEYPHIIHKFDNHLCKAVIQITYLYINEYSEQFYFPQLYLVYQYLSTILGIPFIYINDLFIMYKGLDLYTHFLKLTTEEEVNEYEENQKRTEELLENLRNYLSLHVNNKIEVERTDRGNARLGLKIGFDYGVTERTLKDL